MKAREKDQEFREKYGNLLDKQKKQQWTSGSNKTSNSGFSDAAFDLYASMSLSDFTNEVSELDNKERKELTSFLINHRNDLYVRMETEKETANERFKSGELTREEVGKMLKEIREKYMEPIRDLRSKITIARRNA